MNALPKTRFGKILRTSMREIGGTGRTVVPATIEDASVLEAPRPTLTEVAK